MKAVTTAVSMAATRVDLTVVVTAATTVVQSVDLRACVKAASRADKKVAS